MHSESGIDGYLSDLTAELSREAEDFGVFGFFVFPGVENIVVEYFSGFFVRQNIGHIYEM